MAREESPNGIESTVIDALTERAEEGMTIFELRHQVTADIDTIEEALESLKADGLIETDHSGTRVVIRPSDTALKAAQGTEDESILDRFRERLPL